MKLRAARKLLDGLHCPFCSNHNFNLKLRCDLGYEECLSTAQCHRCGHEFNIEDLIRHRHDTLKKGGEQLEEKACDFEQAHFRGQ